MDIKNNTDGSLEAEESRPDMLIGADPELDAYIRMAADRRNMPAVDVDAAWRSFSSALPKSREAGGRRAAVRVLFAAVAGAAAMFVFLLAFHEQVFSGSSAERQSRVAVAGGAVKRGADVPAARQDKAVPAAADTVLSTRKAAPVVVARAADSSKGSQRVATPAGMDLRVTLSDGSEVWLNAGSSLDFPSSFMGDERRVRLQGEAYFKVTPNQRKPFIVQSDQMSVRVLGTEFNFKSYSSEPARVTLVNGKVEVISEKTQSAVATLSPGEDAWYDRSGEIRVSDADVYAVTQWVKGYFYFRDRPLVEALRELGRWYGLGVVFNNPAAMDFKVHFSALRNAPISAALESLNRLQRITVRVEDGNIAVY